MEKKQIHNLKSYVGFVGIHMITAFIFVPALVLQLWNIHCKVDKRKQLNIGFTNGIGDETTFFSGIKQPVGIVHYQKENVFYVTSYTAKIYRITSLGSNPSIYMVSLLLLFKK